MNPDDYDVVWHGGCRGSLVDHFLRRRGGAPEAIGATAFEEELHHARRRCAGPSIEATPVLTLLEASRHPLSVGEIAQGFRVEPGQVWNAMYRFLQCGLVERVDAPADVAWVPGSRRGPAYAYRPTSRLG